MTREKQGPDAAEVQFLHLRLPFSWKNTTNPRQTGTPLTKRGPFFQILNQ